MNDQPTGFDCFQLNKLAPLQEADAKYRADKRRQLKRFLFDIVQRKKQKALKGNELSVRRKEFFDNDRIDYLSNYLIFQNDTGHDVGTLVVEWNFMSQSFLSDYANYYSSMYESLEKRCIRVHFFNREYWSREQFAKLLLDTDDETTLETAYLGYIVFKPLENSLIGASILKPYPDKEPRFFNAIRPYKIDLFGRKFGFRSLAYQEQDNSVSVCATTALWMAFGKTYKMFRKALPTPYEITASAGIRRDIGRMMPNDALDLNQIIRSIHAVGLDAEVRTGDKTDSIGVPGRIVDMRFLSYARLRRVVYAYSRCNIPILLGYRLNQAAGNQNHMVTITGFRLSPDPPQKSLHRMQLKADSVVKLYAHDDQLGPFSKIEIKEKFVKYLMVKVLSNRDTLAVPTEIVIPIKKSVRIKFEEVNDQVNRLNNFFQEAISKVGGDSSIVWDIYLTRTRDYKDEVLEQASKSGAESLWKGQALEILSDSFPFYIWVAKMYFDGEESMHLIFDSTTIRDNLCIFRAFVLGKRFGEWINRMDLFENPGSQEVFLEFTKNKFQDLEKLKKASEKI